MAIFSAIGTAIAGAYTAISGFIGGIAGTALGAFALRVAAGVGLNLLAQKLAGKQTRQADFSVNGRIQGGGDIPRSFGVGYYCTAGSLVYANTWGQEAGSGTQNAFITQVIALSDMPVRELVELWVNGEKVTIGSTQQGQYGFPIAEYQKNGTNHMWVKFYDGRQTAADPLLVGTVGGWNGRPYQVTRVGRGVAYAVVTAFVGNQSGLFQGFPTYKFGLIGMPLYDQSRDGSRGGLGSQRVGLPNTWGGDGDHLVAVQIANLLMGVRWNGQWQYGIQGMTVNRLPSAHWLQQIAKCRADIAGPDGNEPTFRAGGEIPYDAPLADAIEALLTAAYGRFAETGGFYKIHLGAPDDPVAAFTDGEIISTEEQTFTPFFGLADTINGIVARYPSPKEGWAIKPAPPLYNAGYEAEDGNRRLLADVPLDFVPYDGQVQRLMQAALREARRARRHTLVLPPEYWMLEPGDVVTWTSPRNGYVAKQFRVDGVSDRANLDVMIDVTEIDPADYDWNQETDYRVPVDGPVGPLRPAPIVIVDWFAVGDVVPDNDGLPRGAAIRLSWDGNQPGIVAVLFEVRLAETGEVVHEGRADVVTAGGILISHNILPNVQYQVRGRYVPKGDVDSEWSGWLTVTTPDVRLGDFDVYLPGMQEDIENWFLDMSDWLDEDSPFHPLWLDIEDLDEKVEVIQSELAGILGAEEYDPLEAYLEGTLVQFDGGLYRALQNVPAGTPPTNAAYWDKIGDYASLGDAVVALTARMGEAESEIERTADGFRSTTRDSRRIYNAAMASALLEIDKAGETALEASDQFKATAAVGQWAETEISRVDGVLTVHASDITRVQATLGTKADVSVTQALQTTITEQGNTITSLGGAITAIENTLPGKADVSVVNALQSTVSAHGDEITSLGGQITAVSNNLGDLSADIANNYYTRTQTDDVASTAASAATTALSATLTPQIASKAEASVVSALEAVVNSQGSTITAQASRTDDLFVALGGSTNRLRVKYEVMSGPTGYTRFGIVGSTAGGNDRAASGFMDVPNNSALPTRWAFQSDQFAILDGSGNLNALFDSGTAYIANARIRNLTADNINVQALVASQAFIDNLVVDWADIENVNITSAQIGELTVEEGNIAANAITSQDHDSGTQNIPNDGISYTLCTINIASPSGNPVMLFFSLSNSSNWELRRGTAPTAPLVASGNGPVDRVTMDAGGGVGSHTYALRARNISPGNMSVTGTLIGQCNKK